MSFPPKWRQTRQPSMITITVKPRGETKQAGRQWRRGNVSWTSAGWSCRLWRRWRGLGWRRSRRWWSRQSRDTCIGWIHMPAGNPPAPQQQWHHHRGSVTSSVHTKVMKREVIHLWSPPQHTWCPSSPWKWPERDGAAAAAPWFIPQI